jgi:hypothetical protein
MTCRARAYQAGSFHGRAKGHDSAGSIGESRTKQGFVFFYSTPCIGHQCGKVIVENKDIFVVRIAQSARAFIACS